ncbi:Fc.00g026120.m01.CDS01 [Cosmosporella sp. VM-42]
MSYTLYDASVGVAIDALNALSAILNIAEAHPDADKLPAARLYEDMLPLTFQVHMVTDTAQKVVARTVGSEPLSFKNDLSSFAEMKARISQVLEIAEKADKDTINARAGETVQLGLGPGKNAELTSMQYINGYGLPNLFFHLTTTYSILRNQGVPLGKKDYLRSFLGKYVEY